MLVENLILFLLNITLPYVMMYDISLSHWNLFTFEKEKGTGKNTENNSIIFCRNEIRFIDAPEKVKNLSGSIRITSIIIG
jgi:hypothetical protein